MMKIKAVLLAFTCACAIATAAPPAPKAPAPPLEPGEGLALAGGDLIPYLFGDAQRESPLGSLAWLPWLKLEGAEWKTAGVAYRCTGVPPEKPCSTPKGHGKVDLTKAIQVGCDQALALWIRTSAVIWRKDYGEGAARARMEEVFTPFLGSRMPPGEGIPDLNESWISKGDLLRTSPSALLNWLIDPPQEELVRRVRRLVLNFRDETFKQNSWWVLVGTADVPGAPGVTSAWAVGGNGDFVAVLRLPSGKGRPEALARFRTLLNVSPK